MSHGLPLTIKQTTVPHIDIDDVDKELLERPVIFAFTTRGNDIYYRFVMYIMQQKEAFRHMGLVAASHMWGGKPGLLFDICINVAGEFYHILDPDIAPECGTTLRLMRHDLDIVASPLWYYDGCSNSIHLNLHYDKRCIREYTPKVPEEGLEQIFATSFGSVVIKRRVLEVFSQAKEEFCIWSSLIDEEFKAASPENIFFAKANALGFDVFMDWGCEVGTHNRFVELNSPTIETFVAQRHFDLKYGSERKRELLNTPNGRETLANDLKRGFDLSSTRSVAC